MSKTTRKQPRRKAWHWGLHKVEGDKRQKAKRGHRKHKGRDWQ